MKIHSEFPTTKKQHKWKRLYTTLDTLEMGELLVIVLGGSHQFALSMRQAINRHWAK